MCWTVSLRESFTQKAGRVNCSTVLRTCFCRRIYRKDSSSPVRSAMDMDSIDYSDKSTFCWISVIWLPDFITKMDFDWAVETASKKKKLDCAKAKFLTIDEELCVQTMHIGSFDNEPETVALMNDYITENRYENDFSDTRFHHEIYLSDARKVEAAKWKTVIRHPIKCR